MCRYYLIDDLADAVERQLAKLKDEHEPFCRVPVITSPEEEHLIVSTASKVSVCIGCKNEVYGVVSWLGSLKTVQGIVYRFCLVTY